MAAGEQSAVSKRVSGDKVWIGDLALSSSFQLEYRPFKFEVLATEEAVGQAMYDELVDYAAKKKGRNRVVADAA